jgi:MoaA/NifB/PqqE/SkfB family radical SAM enzyme
MVTPEQIEHLAPLVSYIGVSVDGLEEYHNWWRGSSKINNLINSFDHTIATIKAVLAMPKARESLEVSTVATKRNLTQIPHLVRYLHDIGVEQYSVHRTMQVGRFSRKPELVPTPEDYLRLLTAIVETKEELGMDVHLHHSIESVYATLLLGHDTYVKNKLGNPDKRSSVGIDPKGGVYFDPWCMVPPWDQLNGGSLLENEASLESIFSQGILAIAQEYCRPEVRCHGCTQPCSGGSRIAAAAAFIEQDQSLRPEDVTESHILAGMAEVDPACPLSF